MKSEKFYDLTKSFLDSCMEIMKSKGLSYSGLEDKLGNFKRVAKNLAMSPEQVWFVYFSKHFDALSSYIRGEYSDSEPIDGRIKDMVNYLLLLNGLIMEERQVKAEKAFEEETLAKGYKAHFKLDSETCSDWHDPDDPGIEINEIEPKE